MKFYRSIIFLIIAFSPIIDILYTILYKFINIDLPIQQVIRIAIVLYLFFNIKDKKNKSIIVGLGVLLGIGQIYMIINKYDFSLLNNSSFIIKILSLFCFIYFIKEKLIKNQISIKEIMSGFNISACILSLNIVLSNIFKFGLPTYTYGGRGGYKGFIEAHNDVTVVLLILFPILIYFYKKEKNVYSLITVILTGISLFLIGTKAGKGLLILEILLLTYIYIIKNINIRLIVENNQFIMENKKIFKNGLYILSIILCLICYTNISRVSTALEKHVMSKGYRSVYSYIVSYRDIQPILIDNIVLSQYNVHPKYIFGMGYYYANKVLNDQKQEFHMIENDIDGLIYYTGIFTASIILFILLRISFKIINNQNSGNDMLPFMMVSMVIAYIHLFLGGHLLYSALANTYFGVILGVGYFMVSQKNLKNRLK